MAIADAAVSFALRKLADAALNRALELYDVCDQVEPMQVNLRLIQSFLRDADSKRDQNPKVKQWVKEVREVAHKIEDVMDTFLVEIDENNKNRPESRRSKSCGIIRKIKMIGKNPLKLAWLCDEMKEIRVILNTIHMQTTQLGITNIGGGSEENSRAQAPSRPTNFHYIDVSQVVGFDADKHRIVEHLLDRSILRRTVLSIVGIGGLGKTTLAKKVCDSGELEEQFDCRTWLSISQKFILTKLLREILYSIHPEMRKKDKESKKPIVRDEDLPMELQRSLSEKKYLIILDDVWTTDLWEQLQIALPDINNGSRVLITSRSLEVAKAADPKTSPHILPYLTLEESCTLLLRKALPQEQPDRYPPHIMNVAKLFAKKCGGLPLALTVLGGILLMRNPCAWPTIERTISWHNDKGQKCSQVLAISYNDLPYHLKPCFLYLASLPEDYNILAKRVTRMWIAEGFIPKDGAGTMEDKAHDYLEELVQRCLVQVTHKSWMGYCYSFVVHDLLRDLAIHEAEKENFFTLFSKPEDGSQVDVKVARRVALQSWTPEYGIHSTNTRALLYFGQYIPNYGGFRLLRVLNIEGVYMTAKSVDYKNLLNGLIHLRYLAFIGCGQLHGFEHVSFSSLKNLETLDTRDTKILEGPDHSLWEIPTLRHVISCFSNPFICNAAKLDHLENLQTLKYVRLQKFPNLGCKINLRKLGIELCDDFWEQCGSLEQAQHMLKGLIIRMENLVSLGIWSSGYSLFSIGDTSDLPCYETIQRVYLSGKWPRGIISNVELFPTNLTKLTLRDSKLEQDPMPVLERLKNLMILGLRVRSYFGTKLICSTEGFPSLQTLELYFLPNLCCLDIKEGAMPILHKLKIGSCPMLRALPELQKVPTLQNLTLCGPSGELHESMQSEDMYKIKHIPCVRISEQWYNRL